jgi:hypothetical protein
VTRVSQAPRRGARRWLAALALVLLPLTAAAQPADEPAPDAAPAEQPSQGPMTVTKIHNGFLAVPEYKFTEFDHQHSGLAGGYAGVVFQDALFIGGGGYGLVTNNHGRELAYGGLVMQWFGRSSETLGYSAKMLIGGGEAETTEGIPVVVDPRSGRTVTQAVRVHQDFFVFEPEVNGFVRFNRHLRLSGGAGYRFTGHYYGYGYYGSPYPGHVSPDGWTATVGLQIGSGS